MTMTDVIDLADGCYSGEVLAPPMARFTVEAIVASAIPVKPPRGWFDNPGLNQVTPLTIQSDGRVYGHIAGWKQDHIGMNGRIRAPKSRSNYAFFATGVLETAEGEMVNVGQITMVGGHAPLEASVAEAVAHYDNTDSGMMDVAVGEDRYGIWVAGALRPDVDELSMRRLRASGVSGDWRPINGALELVACCSVNVPGFPIPRARVAAGMPVALVAAGTTEIMEAIIADYAVNNETAAVTAALSAIDDRMRLVEGALLDRILERREAMTAAIAEVQTDGVDLDELEDPEDPLEALRARVHGEVDVSEFEEEFDDDVLVADDVVVDDDDPELQWPNEEDPGEEEPGASVVLEATFEEMRELLRGRVHKVLEPVEVVQPDIQESELPDPQQEVDSLETETEPEAAEEVAPVDMEAVTAALRARVGSWIDGMPMEFSFADCEAASAQSLQASLRARAHGDTLVAAPKEYSAAERRRAKNKRHTMPDGSFPIENTADLKRAISSYGRAKNKAAAKRHIMARAKTLGATKLLPDTWKSNSK